MKQFFSELEFTWYQFDLFSKLLFITTFFLYLGLIIAVISILGLSKIETTFGVYYIFCSMVHTFVHLIFKFLTENVKEKSEYLLMCTQKTRRVHRILMWLGFFYICFILFMNLFHWSELKLKTAKFAVFLFAQNYISIPTGQWSLPITCGWINASFKREVSAGDVQK